MMNLTLSKHNKRLISFIILFFTLHSFSLSYCQVKIYAKSSKIVSTDGFPLDVYELYAKQKKPTKPKALFFYIQGSGCNSVTDKIGFLASAVIMGGKTVLMEKRGCTPEDINNSKCAKFYTKDIRVSDHLAVINHFSNQLEEDIPIILIGGSEGGDVACKIAASTNKISHLILLGSGGGISQIEEFKLLIEKNSNYVGLSSIKDLDDKINEINNTTNDNLLWAGLPYKRWKTFWNDPSIKYLKDIKIPVLLLHGNKDNNVPIESARILNDLLKNKIDITYVEYDGLNHSFVNVKNNKSYYPKIEIDIIHWLSNKQILSEDDTKKFIKRVKKNHKDLFSQI